MNSLKIFRFGMLAFVLMLIIVLAACGARARPKK